MRAAAALLAAALALSPNAATKADPAAPASPSSAAPAADAPRSRMDIRNFDVADPKASGRGGEVYQSNCAACHDQGLGNAPQRALFTFMSPHSIVRALTSGAMKAQGQSLSDADKAAVAEYLSGKKLAQAAAPEPPACQGAAARFDFAEPPVFPGWGLSPGAVRAIPAGLAGIDKARAGKLRLKWAVAFPNASQMRSEPALGGGAVFVGSHNGEVYALDRQTGCARWIHQAGSEVRTAIVLTPWTRGDAKARPLAFFGDIVGNVYALDAQTGAQVWRIRAEPSPYATITGAPSLYEGVLYVPVSQLEGMRPVDPMFPCCKSRGAVVALDAQTAAVKWRTYTTAEPRLLGLNAKGGEHYGPAGASVWSSPTIDAKRRQLYVGTGGNSTSPATDTSDSIIALDLATGRVNWVYQGLSGDASNLACLAADKTSCPTENGPDYDFGAGAMLTTSANGRQMLVAGQKSGEVHAIDPDTGKLIWKAKPGRGGILGGIHFSLAADGGLVFAPVNDTPNLDHKTGKPYVEPAHPGVYALELATGRTVWSAPADASACVPGQPCRLGYSQAITAIGGLVFAGASDGTLRAFDARTGALVWRYDTTRPVRTVNGVDASGGSFGGGAGPIAYRGMLFAGSGYARTGVLAGNVLFAFEAR
jgi:polyvinyl alcohol dehydrogenase (cytochrome)